jgi:hypothetical protein
MFLSNDITISFKNIKDVIRAYPEWTLISLEGKNIHIFLGKARRQTNFHEALHSRSTSLL